MKENVKEEVLVLKDLQKEDTVFLKLKREVPNKVFISIQEYFEKKLGCNVVILTSLIDVVTKNKEATK